LTVFPKPLSAGLLEYYHLFGVSATNFMTAQAVKKVLSEKSCNGTFHVRSFKSCASSTGLPNSARLERALG
jgi:hypothetical protein